MNTLRFLRLQRLGIDLGHTIYDVANDRPFPHAFRVIRRLADERFGIENIHIVSRVTPLQEVRARKIVSTREFKTGVGIPLKQVHFCRERHEKGPICIRLRLSRFIDDRPDVLMHMPPGVQRILFNPTPEDVLEYAVKIRKMVLVRTWIDIENIMFPA